MSYTQSERRRIIESHIAEYGEYIPKDFLALAEHTEHPAHNWFNWNDTKAAHNYRLNQAREFIQGIKVMPSNVRIVDGPTQVISLSIPMVVSPLENRQNGGGYILADSERGRIALREESVSEVQKLLDRYQGVWTETEINAAAGLLASLQIPIAELAMAAVE